MDTLKEIDGRYYQKAQVVIVTTKNIVENGNQLHLYIKGNLVIPKTSGEAKRLRDYQNYKPQHLYITSSEKIKEGDWILFQFGSDLVEQVTKILPNGDIIVGENNHKHPKCCRKIIATTDDSLGFSFKVNHGASTTTAFTSLPQPSKQFIEKYVEEYNKGNTITDVLVEYEIGQCNCNVNSLFDICINEFNSCTESRLKTKSDNTITIKKVKDTYSREEVEKLVINALKTRVVWQSEVDKWIKENL